MNFFADHRVPASPSQTLRASPTDPASEPPPSIGRLLVPRRDLPEPVINEATREQLDAALPWVMHAHTLAVEWGFGAIDPSCARVAMNFHGPPGTGKTLCAEWVALRLARPLLVVAYGELESRYVGETAKNIAAAFTEARRQRAALFFDEADTLLGRRLTAVESSADHAVNASRNAMLQQLDLCEGVVIFATNLLRSYDPAFLRRIRMHIEFMLPDLGCRTILARRYLSPKLPRAEDVAPEWLAAETEGLSPSEMLNAVEAAAARAVVRPVPMRYLVRCDLRAAIASIRASRAAVERGKVPSAQPRLVPLPALREGVTGVAQGGGIRRSLEEVPVGDTAPRVGVAGGSGSGLVQVAQLPALDHGHPGPFLGAQPGLHGVPRGVVLDGHSRCAAGRCDGLPAGVEFAGLGVEV